MNIPTRSLARLGPARRSRLEFHRPRGTRRGFGRLLAVGPLAVVALLALALWAPWSGTSIDRPDELTLYCAAGMRRPVEATVADYEREYGVAVRLEIGGSGQLLSKLRAAPDHGDLFLAADASYIEIARREGLVSESIPLARIQPVLVVNRATQQRLTAAQRPVTGLDDLLRDDLQVVLANPELASIGRVTKQLLMDSGHWAELEARLSDASSARVSTVGTVTEVAQAVRLRDGLIGVVWDVEARQHAELEMITAAQWETAEEYVTLGVLSRVPAARAAEVHRFARFLAARDRGLRHFEQYHFRPVEDAAPWRDPLEPAATSGEDSEDADARVEE